MSDISELRRAYARLRDRRHAAGAASSVSLEQILAFAEQPPTDDAGLAALDAVLADPKMRDEYILLRSLARERAKRAGVPRWYAVAALAALALGVPLVWRATSGPGNVTRGTADGFVVTSLAPDDSVVAAGDALTWRSVDRATYIVEFLDANATAAWSQATPDTTLILPAATPLEPGVSYTLQVTATTPEGAQQRTPGRRVTLAR
jgi:hypothetical protein